VRGWQPLARKRPELSDTYLDSGVWLHRFAVLVASVTFLLIIAGALVTGNEAGLSVPDWPLSYGTWMPPMIGGIFYEHGHRMIATLVGLLTTILAIWLWRKEARNSVRRLGLIALATVIAQGILGGVTVLFFLPTVISVMHACLAQAFFCIVVSLAWVTSHSWKWGEISIFGDQEDFPLTALPSYHGKHLFATHPRCGPPTLEIRDYPAHFGGFGRNRPCGLAGRQDL
jgi:hypothetical protein